MFPLSAVISLYTILLGVSAASLNGTQPRASCTVTSYDQVATAVSQCSDITIDGIEVPAGQTLTLNLRDGAKLTFKGHIKFGQESWAGPLLDITGKGMTVQGETGHILDGQGPLYWKAKASSKKSKYFKIRTTGGSLFSNINLLNCPAWCVSIASSDLTLEGWNIDCSAGDPKIAHNTDGFDISSSTNIVIKNSVVKNQDDCIAVNQGSNMHFSNLHCSGSHGLSLSVGMSETDYNANVVENITFSDSFVENGRNGIHIKTHKDGGSGAIKDVTYKNIEFSDIKRYGINIQEDYGTSGSTGHAVGNVPITNLRMINVTGTVSGSDAMPVYILCGSDGCSDWSWSDVSVTGGSLSNSCNFTPSGFSC